MKVSIDDLRRYAIARSLFEPTTLERALLELGFVQADPIRAPARAQDLTLRHRVKDYRAGDLERRYGEHEVEEGFFVNYGFMPRVHHALMFPRSRTLALSGTRKKQAALLLAFIEQRGAVHPREVDAHFAHGTVVNYWGGSSNATTHLLDALHYRGFLRVVRRDAGVRVYALRESIPEVVDRAERARRLDALVDVAVRAYAPLPSVSLARLVARLRYGAPQWKNELAPALGRAKERLAHAVIDGRIWYFPADEVVRGRRVEERVRLLTPFDPVVWDRHRFEVFWGWAYRFEAYTPVAKRRLGYYALPLLWRDRVIGWSNLTFVSNELRSEFGFVSGRAPRDPLFRRELEAELARMQIFLSPRRRQR